MVVIAKCSCSQRGRKGVLLYLPLLIIINKARSACHSLAISVGVVPCAEHHIGRLTSCWPKVWEKRKTLLNRVHYPFHTLRRSGLNCYHFI